MTQERQKCLFILVFLIIIHLFKNVYFEHLKIKPDYLIPTEIIHFEVLLLVN